MPQLNTAYLTSDALPIPDPVIPLRLHALGFGTVYYIASALDGLDSMHGSRNNIRSAFWT